MSDYYIFHIIELFAAMVVGLALIIVLINNYFKENIKIFRRKIMKFMLLVITFIINVAFATVNLINPIKIELYNIVSPFLLLLILIFGFFALSCSIKKINKFIVITGMIMIFILIAGVMKFSVFRIEPILFVLFGLLFGTIFLALFIMDFLIHIIGGKKRKLSIYASKISRKKILVNGAIIIILLVAIVSSIFILSPKQELTNELVILSWYDYFTNESITSFEKEYGVNVTIYNYGAEPIMEDNITKHPEMFDIVVMPDEYVKKLRGEGRLAPINKRYIPRLKNIGKEFLNKKYDPNNLYSIPYLWGTTGILINKNYVEENDTWGIFFNKKYIEKIVTFNTPSDFIGITSAYLGYGYVPTKISQLLRIEQFLEFQKKLLFLDSGHNILLYTDEGEFEWDDLITDKVWGSQFYSGDALAFMEDHDNLTYVIPKEGGVKWIDSFTILKGSKNKNTAEAFINHILDPMRSAAISNMTKFPTSNTEAMKYVDSELIGSEAFLPSEDTLSRLKYISDFDIPEDVERLKEKLWEELNEI